MSSSQLLLTLINNILDLRKIESGKADVALVPFRALAVCADAVRAVHPIAAQKGLVITVIVEARGADGSDAGSASTTMHAPAAAGSPSPSLGRKRERALSLGWSPSMLVSSAGVGDADGGRQYVLMGKTSPAQPALLGEWCSADAAPGEALWANDVCVGDSMRIHATLINLLANAVKYTDGAIELCLRRRRRARSGSSPSHCMPSQSKPAAAYAMAEEELVFSVSDRGQGIRPEDVQKLFRKFSQLDGPPGSEHAPGQMGTGLGLNICKRCGNILPLIGSASFFFESHSFFFFLHGSKFQERGPHGRRDLGRERRWPRIHLCLLHPLAPRRRPSQHLARLAGPRRRVVLGRHLRSGRGRAGGGSDNGGEVGPVQAEKVQPGWSGGRDRTRQAGRGRGPGRDTDVCQGGATGGSAGPAHPEDPGGTQSSIILCCALLCCSSFFFFFSFFCGFFFG
jgi:hypothetical protein